MQRTLRGQLRENLEKTPPVLRSVEYTHDTDAVVTRKVEDQHIVEAAHMPFAKPGKFGAFQQ